MQDRGKRCGGILLRQGSGGKFGTLTGNGQAQKDVPGKPMEKTDPAAAGGRGILYQRSGDPSRPPQPGGGGSDLPQTGLSGGGGTGPSGADHPQSPAGGVYCQKV